MNQFWMVYSPGGMYPPRVQHQTETEAVSECERLARSNPGQQFFVLAATEMRVVDNMKRVKFQHGQAIDDDGIPF